jgi:anion-transporting  ArsA/GET3 family ATPase
VTVGKVWELAQLDRRVKKGSKYDLVIVDAPATGHSLGLLRTPKTFSQIARVGPIKRQADTINGFVTDPNLTGVCAVAWPEEMPVNETLDLQRNLKTDIGLDLDRIVMNGIYPEVFSDAEAKTLRDRYRSELDADGRGGIEVVRRAALRAAMSEHDRASAHREQLQRLEDGSNQDVVELPFLFEPTFDMNAVESLADTLEDAL